MEFKDERARRNLKGCAEIAEQRTELARARLARDKKRAAADAEDGFRKKRKKGGNGRQPSGNAILSDLFFQHGLLSILIVMAQGAGLMIAGAMGGLVRLVTATGATVATVTRDTTPVPTVSPVIALDAAKAAPSLRRRSPRLDHDGSSGGNGGPTPEPVTRDPLDKLATKIMHDLRPPEDRWEGISLVRQSHPGITAYLYGGTAYMTPDMIALRNDLTRLTRGGATKAQAMAQCMPTLEAIVAKDAASRADFQKPGQENDGDGPGARKPLPGEEPELPTPSPKFF